MIDCHKSRRAPFFSAGCVNANGPFSLASKSWQPIPILANITVTHRVSAHSVDSYTPPAQHGRVESHNPKPRSLERSCEKKSPVEGRGAGRAAAGTVPAYLGASAPVGSSYTYYTVYGTVLVESVGTAVLTGDHPVDESGWVTIRRVVDGEGPAGAAGGHWVSGLWRVGQEGWGEGVGAR